MGTYIDINECAERLDTALDRIGYLSMEQARKINYNNALCDAAIKLLVRQNRAFYSSNKKFLLRQPWRKPYGPIIGAVDVMLAFLTNIDINNIFAKEYVPVKEDGEFQPSSINPQHDRLLLGFTRHGRMYEIYSANSKESLNSIYEYLKERHKNYMENCSDPAGIRYLIMVKNTSLFLYEAPEDADYLYAFAYVSKENNEVKVEFYNPLAPEEDEPNQEET